MHRDVAEQIAALMLETGAKLNASVAEVQASASADEFSAYRGAVARIMGEMLLEIMNPIFDEYPDLKPPDLDRT